MEKKEPEVESSIPGDLIFPTDPFDTFHSQDSMTDPCEIETLPKNPKNTMQESPSSSKTSLLNEIFLSDIDDMDIKQDLDQNPFESIADASSNTQLMQGDEQRDKLCNLTSSGLRIANFAVDPSIQNKKTTEQSLPLTVDITDNHSETGNLSNTNSRVIKIQSPHKTYFIKFPYHTLQMARIYTILCKQTYLNLCKKTPAQFLKYHIFATVKSASHELKLFLPENDPLLEGRDEKLWKGSLELKAIERDEYICKFNLAKSIVDINCSTARNLPNFHDLISKGSRIILTGPKISQLIEDHGKTCELCLIPFYQYEIGEKKHVLATNSKQLGLEGLYFANNRLNGPEGKIKMIMNTAPTDFKQNRKHLFIMALQMGTFIDLNHDTLSKMPQLSSKVAYMYNQMIQTFRTSNSPGLLLHPHVLFQLTFKNENFTVNPNKAGGKPQNLHQNGITFVQMKQTPVIGNESNIGQPLSVVNSQPTREHHPRPNLSCQQSPILELESLVNQRNSDPLAIPQQYSGRCSSTMNPKQRTGIIFGPGNRKINTTETTPIFQLIPSQPNQMSNQNTGNDTQHTRTSNYCNLQSEVVIDEQSSSSSFPKTENLAKTVSNFAKNILCGSSSTSPITPPVGINKYSNFGNTKKLLVKPFDVFTAEVRKDITVNQPNLTKHEISKIIVARWKDLPESIKQNYTDKASQQNALNLKKKPQPEYNIDTIHKLSQENTKAFKTMHIENCETRQVQSQTLPPLPTIQINCPFSASQCSKRSHKGFDRFLDHLINEHFKNQIKLKLLALVNGRPHIERLQCPAVNCGYIATRIAGLVLHFGKCHQVTQELLCAEAEKYDLDLTEIDRLGFFKKIPEDPATLIMCNICYKTCLKINFAPHTALIHCLDIMTKQMGCNSLATGICPWERCNRSFTDEEGSARTILMVKHYLSHRTLEDILKRKVNNEPQKTSTIPKTNGKIVRNFKAIGQIVRLHCKACRKEVAYKKKTEDYIIYADKESSCSECDRQKKILITCRICDKTVDRVSILLHLNSEEHCQREQIIEFFQNFSTAKGLKLEENTSTSNLKFFLCMLKAKATHVNIPVATVLSSLMNVLDISMTQYGQLYQHLDLLVGKAVGRYFCYICNTIGFTWEQLSKHAITDKHIDNICFLRANRRPPAQYYLCTQCDDNFEVDDMNQHTHFYNETNAIENTTPAEITYDSEEDEPFIKRKHMEQMDFDNPTKRKRRDLSEENNAIENVDTPFEKTSSEDLKNNEDAPEIKDCDPMEDVKDPRFASLTRYFYFCLDCEELLKDSDDESSNPNHPKVPLSIDLASHIVATGHQRFNPIQDQTKVVLENISYNKEFHRVVIKQWKRMVIKGEIDVRKYKMPRGCLKCEAVFDDPIDMLKHIKNSHI